jgi:HSP20 family protein
MCNQQMYARGQQHGRRHGFHHWGAYGRYGSMPVNIEEKEDQFKVSLYAPGLDKAHININVKDDLLYITYKKPDEAGSEASFTRREYLADSFERSFLLKRKVEVEKISAFYQEGILKVILPKNPETNKPAHTITVA